MKDLVSVIIPCFNHGKYIQESVNSVLNQTYENIEIIIVNDGSDDEYTLKILNEIDNSKIIVIHTRNQGLSAARNNGIKIASGKFILPLDSDDLIHPSFLEKTVPILIKNNNIGLVGTYFEHFEESSFKGDYCVSGGVELYVNSEPNTLCTSLYNREDWLKIGGYDESMKEGLEDWEFALRLLFKTNKKVYIVGEFLFKYRIKNSSMATEVNEDRAGRFIYLIKKYPDVFKENFINAIISREKKISELVCYLKKEKYLHQQKNILVKKLALNLLLNNYLNNYLAEDMVFLYGYCDLGVMLFDDLNKNNILLEAFVDQSADILENKDYKNKSILSPHRFMNTYDNSTIIIASIENEENIIAFIKDLSKKYNKNFRIISIKGITII